MEFRGLHSQREMHALYAFDLSPDLAEEDHFNLQKHPSDSPGEHWVVIYVSYDGDYGEFFDSFGRPTAEFEHYMNKHCSKWTYNRNQLQSIASRFCGLYCACYCIVRSRNVDVTRFVRYFTNDTGLTDVFMHELMCRILDI